MNEYKSDISLRVSHPTMTPDLICSILGMEADVKRTVGEGRTNNVGRKLSGVWKETYCGFDLSCRTSESIPHVFRELIDELSAKKPALDEICSTGGMVQIYVLATPNEGTFGEKISWQLMHGLSALKIDFSLEVYKDIQE